MRMILGLILSSMLAGLQGPVPPPVAVLPPPVRIVNVIPETGDRQIEGVVRRLDTGEPLPNANVELTGLQDRATGGYSIREAKTDAVGRFVFLNVPESIYTVRVTMAGFFAPPIAGISGLVVAASVNTGLQKTSSLAFSLAPGGTINGVVRDAVGQPLPNVSVSAMKIGYRDGRKTLQNAKTVQSDDRGEFRLFGLPAGEYYVRASDIYFPGVPEAELATLVTVRGGDEVPASIRFPESKTFRISGTVANAIPELAGEPAYFVLLPRGAKIDVTAVSMFFNFGRGLGQGYFEIAGVRPGSYDLIPVASGPGNAASSFATALPLGTSQIYTGRIPVEVRDRDVEGVTVDVTRGTALTVRVSATATPTSAPAVAAPSVSLALRVVDAFPTPGTATNLNGRLVSAGSMTQFNVPAGTYAIVAVVMTPGFQIVDIRQAARSIYDQNTITVGRASAEPVEVVLAAAGGRVEGTVEGADKTSITTRVSLVPDGSRRDNLLLYRRATVTDGRFVLADIPLGSYKLYAWEDLPPGADENAEFMTAYENRGRTVTVRDGAAITAVAVPLIKR